MATINVKLPDGTMQPMSYPDDWSKDQLKQAIHKKFSKVQQPQQQAQQPVNQSLGEKYQDFMNPDKVNVEGKPMVETMFGRMNPNPAELNAGTPENKNMLEEMIDTSAGAPGIKTIAQAPLKLSLKGIMNKIVESKNKEKLYHSGEYNKLWKAAKNAGIEKVKLNPELVDIETLKASRVDNKYIRPLEKLMENPTLENAQIAQSDLGKLINGKQLSKDVLPSEESAAKRAAIAAQEHIKDMMFRDEAGKINEPLKNAYTKVSESYKNNFKPYDIAPIKKYERGKMTAKQLMQRLKSGEFMAEKGAVHPEIERRDFMLDLLSKAGIPLGAAGAGAVGGGYLLKKLMEGND